MGATSKKQFIHRDMYAVEKVISFILFLMLVASLYLSLPLSRLQNIQAVGSDLTSQQIIDASELKKQQHTFEVLFLPNEITKRIQNKYPKVKSVVYQMTSDNQLTMVAEEYPVIATVTYSSDNKTILQSGFVYNDYAMKYKGSVVDVQWEGTPESLQFFSAELAKVSENIRKQIVNVIHYESDLLTTTLYMADGNQVKVNYTEFHEKLNYYDEMVSKTNRKLGVFDLTVGIFFTPYR